MSINSSPIYWDLFFLPDGQFAVKVDVDSLVQQNEQVVSVEVEVEVDVDEEIDANKRRLSLKKKKSGQQLEYTVVKTFHKSTGVLYFPDLKKFSHWNS